MFLNGNCLQIDPDVDEDQRKNPERKKLKLKEVHLTKLLSTKARGTKAPERRVRIAHHPRCRGSMLFHIHSHTVVCGLPKTKCVENVYIRTI